MTIGPVAADVGHWPGLALDVYGAATNGAAVLLIHGGGWFQGDKRKEAPLAARIAAAGYLVFVPDYRLAPANRFPASRDDVLAALDWALASDHRFDRDRVAVWGGSAGGNLAVEVALATGRPAVSWSGLLDLEGAIRDTDDAAAASTDVPDPATASATIDQNGRDDAFLRWCILGLVGGDRATLADATPLRRVTAASGPIYMANSTDEFVHASDPMRMQEALCAAGVESVVQFVPGKAHAEGYAAAVIAPSLAFVAAKLDVAI